MDALPLPLTRDVVLIGGGHTHALLLRAWGMSPLAGARLTVINPAATAPYTGMLPGYVAGHYGRDDLEIDLVRLARFAGARMIFGKVDGIDRAAKHLTIAGRPPIAYDLVSFDIGITSNMPEIAGFSDHAIAAKPLGPFAMRWHAHLADGGGDVVVIGGGIAGVELALAMHHALQGRGTVTLVESEQLLTGVSSASKTRLVAELSAKNIAVLENEKVAEVHANSVLLASGQSIAAKLTVGAAGARPFPWLKDTGLDLTDGFITVDKSLRSVSDPDVFAVGDCAHLSHAPRPKAGVFAVRAAPVLNENIRAHLTGGTLKPFNPQAHYLKLVSLGEKIALADKWGRTIAAPWVWRWKDRIDQRFMSKLADLPKMEPPALPRERTADMESALGHKPMCGGCGSKVGAGVLDAVLTNLPSTQRADVVLSSGDDAAVIAFSDTQQVITTDHLRAFWDDPWVFARIAALHALGDVWAMGAAPQAALVQLILPPLSPDLQSRWMTEIMTASTEVFGAEGATIAGGHTTQGAELTLGFTVTGLTRDRTIDLGGGLPGDQLLLTRPIGSGVLLAAEMQGQARGADIEGLLGVLTTTQGDAAGILAKTAHAMTDVTGFGLAGHVARMARASGVSASLSLDQMPVFSGAEELSATGIRSTLWPSNKAAPETSVPDTPRGDLLFDPQSAGGLLAALPAESAETTLQEIRSLGHDACLIGTLEARGEVILRAD